MCFCISLFVFFKQKTTYEMRISDWSSDVCSSDLRIAQFVIGFITVSVMLVAIPGVRAVGVTLMASAGIAGLVLGAAAQPALKNLIAGIQMAFTEPIRLDDVVIIEGEWGRIRSEEHTSELQSLMRISYAVVFLKTQNTSI